MYYTYNMHYTNNTYYMQNIDSVQLQRHFGQTLQDAMLEPIMIKKHKKDFVVLMSAKRYKELTQIEEKALLDLVLKADKKGYIGVKKSKKLLTAILEN